MILKDRYLVVVAMLRGRGFSRRPNCQIVAEAKFDREILSTDPVSLDDEEVAIEQELAWELNKKSLREHRIHRSSLKLQFYLLEANTAAKEPFGYIVYDVRSASHKREFKWLPILNTNYKKSPELLCSVYIDGDGQELAENNPAQTNLASCLTEQGLVPHRCSSGEAGSSEPFFRIGPPKLARENFLFHIEILRLSNLIEFIPINIALPSAGLSGFQLSIEQLPNTTESFVTESFHSVSSVTLTSNTFTTRIKFVIVEISLTPIFNSSAVDILRIFFAKEPFLNVSLLCEGNHVAEAKIPLQNLMATADHAFNTSCALTALQPLVRPDGDFRATSKTEDGPFIEAKITLMRERNLPPPPSKQKRHLRFLTDQAAEPENPVADTPKRPPDSSRHFSLTIDIKRLVGDLTKFEAPVEISYLYQPIGMQHPVSIVASSENQDQLDGCYNFEFLSSWDSLRTLLPKERLLVTVAWATHVIGTLSLNLGQLLPQNNELTSNSFNVNEEVPSDEDTNVTLRLHATLRLTDHGALPFILGQQANALKGSNTSPKRRSRSVDSCDRDEKENFPDDIRSTKEYRAALELEMWKTQMEEEFMAKMRDREEFTMNTLAQEWHRREQDREAICRKKLKDYRELEDQVRKLLGELKQREQRLAADESEFARNARDLQQELASKRREIQHVTQRKIREAEQMAELERQQASHWKRLLNEHQNRITEMERQLARVTRTASARQSTSVSPKSPANDNSKKSIVEAEVRVARLEAELAQSKLEREQLAQQLEEAQRNAARFKQMWSKTLNEVARLREEAETSTKQALKDRENELRDLRARLLPSDSTAGTDPIRQVHSPPVIAEVELAEVMKESQINRLLRERQSLLESGVYNLSDGLILDLDQEIRKSIEADERLRGLYNYEVDEDGRGHVLKGHP